MAAMRAPRPGLRQVGVRLRNKSNDVAKVQVVIAAGAELVVDDATAAQLLQSPAFEAFDDEDQGAPVEEAGGGSARRSSGRRSSPKA